MNPALVDAFARGGGVLDRSCHRHLRSQIDKALSRGEIQSVAHGVYAPAGPLSLATRVAAAQAVDPTVVILGAAAAALTWWPEAPVPQVEVATPVKRRDAHGIAWTQRCIPEEWVGHLGGLRVSAPELAVLDMMPLMGGTPLDEALRRRATSLPRVRTCFDSLAPRRGDRIRRTLLEESRDSPWSEAERRLHVRYRALSLPHRYETNHRVDLPDGSYRLIDLALPELLLGFEVDGYSFHRSHEAFCRDRRSDALLATLSWQRIRFDAGAVLSKDPWVSDTMRAVIKQRSLLLGEVQRRLGHGPPRAARGFAA